VVLGCPPGKRFLCCVQSFQLPKQAELHPLVDVVSPTHSASFKTILERERGEASCARYARKRGIYSATPVPWWLGWSG